MNHQGRSLLTLSIQAVLTTGLTLPSAWATDEQAFTHMPTPKKDIQFVVQQKPSQSLTPTLSRLPPNLDASGSDKSEQALKKLATFYQPYNANQSNYDTSLVTENFLTHPTSTLNPLQANTAFTTSTPTITSKHLANLQSCFGTWAYQPFSLSSQTTQIQALADNGYYNNADYVELSGNVIVNQGNQQIRADKLTLNPLTNDSSAVGNVVFGSTSALDLTAQTKPYFSQDDIMGVADKLSYNTHTGTIHASNVAFASTSLHAHGTAQTLTHDTSTQYILDTASFSTCPPNQRTWQIDADKITLDSDTGRGVAKNMTLNIYNTPIFYLPYFSFAIDSRRASGFLTPKIGINSKDGIQLSTPYYINLAPNYDATITPTINSNKTLRIGGEFRYLTAYGSAGLIDGAYLPQNSKQDKTHRFHLFATHHWRSTAYPALSTYATYRQVSDSHYLSDFDVLSLENTPLNLPRTIGAQLIGDKTVINLEAETFQELQATDQKGNLILDEHRPYARLPQLTIKYTLPTALPNLTLTGISDTTYFHKNTKSTVKTTNGLRLYNHLQARYPFTYSWGYVIPQAALSHLYVNYSNANQQNNHRSVFAPTIGFDSGVFFEKKSTNAGMQILAPRLKYIYSPYRLQEDMPIFNTRFASMSYDQLLADSWVLGYDRLSSLHTITPAITYTYLNKNGETKLDMGVAEQFYLSDSKHRLTTTQTASSSGVAWRASIQPVNGFWADLSGSFTQDYAINTVIGAARYEPSAGNLYAVGVVKRRANDAVGQSALSAITGSVVFPIRHSPYRLMGTFQYDLINQQPMETIFGIGYEDCCISGSIYGRRYRNSLAPSQPPEHSVMAELRLNGISSTGKLGQLLTDRIIGYHSLTTQSHLNH